MSKQVNLLRSDNIMFNNFYNDNISDTLLDISNESKRDLKRSNSKIERPKVENVEIKRMERIRPKLIDFDKAFTDAHEALKELRQKKERARRESELRVKEN